MMTPNSDLKQSPNLRQFGNNAGAAFLWVNGCKESQNGNLPVFPLCEIKLIVCRERYKPVGTLQQTDRTHSRTDGPHYTIAYVSVLEVGNAIASHTHTYIHTYVIFRQSIHKTYAAHTWLKEEIAAER